MIVAAIILGLVIIGLIIFISYLSDKGGSEIDVGIFFGTVLSIFVIIEICIVSEMKEEPKPTPMDVYQGKTTLEYTIRDGEVLESVVVWKEEVK